MTLNVVVFLQHKFNVNHLHYFLPDYILFILNDYLGENKTYLYCKKSSQIWLKMYHDL